MKIEYTCKFCRRPFSFECKVPTDIPFDLEKWKAMLCCNPCHDYERGRRDTQDGIAREIAKLHIARQGRPPPEKLKAAEEAIRSNLVSLTKRYASVICAHNKKPNYWELVLVEHLMARPDLAGSTLIHYRRTIERTI